MSGPKVVRIVTEEEKIAICDTQIALLSAAYESLFRYLERHEISDQGLEKKLHKKLAHYKKIATPDNYGDLRTLIQRELDYISSEKEALQKKGLEKASLQRRKVRHLLESIRTLQMICSRSHANAPVDFSLKYSDLCELSEIRFKELEQEVASELSKIANSGNNKNLNVEQSAFRDRLASPEGELTVSQWKLENTAIDKEDDNSNRTDVLLAELDQVELPEPRKVEYQSQIDSLYEEESDQQRALLLDSIVINLSADLREFKRLQELRNELAMIRAQLDILENRDAKHLSLQLEKGMTSENVEVLENILGTATEKLKTMLNARSMKSGREALIHALASHGYRVNEGMQTAVVQNGKLVVKKPAEETYGVELQTVAETGKFQLRLVSGMPNNERSVTDDVAEERQWCSDLAKIRKSLASSGVELTIEKALEPGAAAVRHSALMAELMESDRRQVPSSKREMDR